MYDSEPPANLVKQESAPEDRACTAYSLVNLARILRAKVTEDQLSKLRDEAVNHRPHGLTPDQKRLFLNKFGLDYKFLGNNFSEFAGDNSTFLGEFIKLLRIHPISFTISSAMSLYQDSRSPDGVKHTGTPGVGHQIVATLDDDRVRIIDPYVPETKLHSYQTNNMNSMENLLATITSRAGQHFLEQGKKPITRDSVRAECLMRLHTPNSAGFIRLAMTGNEMYTAIPIR